MRSEFLLDGVVKHDPAPPRVWGMNNSQNLCVYTAVALLDNPCCVSRVVILVAAYSIWFPQSSNLLQQNFDMYSLEANVHFDAEWIWHQKGPEGQSWGQTKHCQALLGTESRVVSLTKLVISFRKKNHPGTALGKSVEVYIRDFAGLALSRWIQG